MKKYDALIIGFGKGGKTLAAALGKKGIKTAVIEKSPLMYGGSCSCRDLYRRRPCSD